MYPGIAERFGEICQAFGSVVQLNELAHTAIFAGLVASSREDTFSYTKSLTLQARVVELFHRSVEGVTVDNNDSLA